MRLFDITKRLRDTPSFGQRLDALGGIGPGFDFCRVALSLSVLAWHSRLLVDGAKALKLDQFPGQWLAAISTLPMFFALSGFLITGSALRLSVKNFLINRGLRIYPALGVEILLSAFLLGPVFTSLPPGDYFTASETYNYLYNLTGYIQFHLPGLFLKNPFTVVNGSLWTVPVELACYAIITLLILTRALPKSGWIAGFATAYPLLWLVYTVRVHTDGLSGVTAYLSALFFNEAAQQLIPCFLYGISLYMARYRIPYSPWIFCGALLILGVMGVVGEQNWTHDPGMNIIANSLLSYIVIFIGLSRIPKLPFFHRGDYSYGIYLYAYPIQQVLREMFPAITTPVHMLTSAIIVTLIAAFSWHCIEEPILKLRKYFSFMIRKREED